MTGRTRQEEKDERRRIRVANEKRLRKQIPWSRRARSFVTSFLEYAGVSTAAVVVMGFFAISVLASLAISVAIILLFLDLIGVVDVVSWL